MIGFEWNALGGRECNNGDAGAVEGALNEADFNLIC